MSNRRKGWLIASVVIAASAMLILSNKEDWMNKAADQIVTQSRTSTFPPVRMQGYLPNFTMFTHENQKVHFYEDLIKDKVVLINFIYTTCGGICVPSTANLVQVQQALAERVGRDIFIYSITLDPAIDTPERLDQYAKVFNVQPGWLFLTGNYREIEQLRYKLGVYDLDPEVDADKTQHAGLLVYGNEARGSWGALPALLKPQDIVKAVLKVL